jgi:hypothetical protein
MQKRMRRPGSGCKNQGSETRRLQSAAPASDAVNLILVRQVGQVRVGSVMLCISESWRDSTCGTGYPGRKFALLRMIPKSPRAPVGAQEAMHVAKPSPAFRASISNATGGKQHMRSCHHALAEALHAYIASRSSISARVLQPIPGRRPHQTPKFCVHFSLVPPRRVPAYSAALIKLHEVAPMKNL